MPRTVFTPATFARVGISSLTKRTREAIDRGLFKAVQASKVIAIQAIRNTKPHAPIDTGELVSSYVVKRRMGGWLLVNEAPHAGFMEHGTKPHTPPFGPIFRWAKRKSRGTARQSQSKQRLRTRRQGVSKRATLSKPGQQFSAKKRAAHQSRQQNLDAMRLARGTIRSIQQRGTLARGFHARASQHFATLSVKHVQAELRKVR